VPGTSNGQLSFFGAWHFFVWIVIIGEDGIMETAMIADNYESYLHPSKGYKYLGQIKEVFE
jgi:hypothetical protein